MSDNSKRFDMQISADGRVAFVLDREEGKLTVVMGGHLHEEAQVGIHDVIHDDDDDDDD